MVNLCKCTGHGECQFDQLAEGYELKQSFRVVQCNCSKGWEGEEHMARRESLCYVYCDNYIQFCIRIICIVVFTVTIVSL